MYGAVVRSKSEKETKEGGFSACAPTVPQLTKNSPLAKSKVTLVGHGRDGADLRAGRRSRQLRADGTSAKAGTP
jgi:hypothetical protein